MLKQEWKAIFKNKFTLIVLIAIITIPSIYTNIFLGSMWDPYGEVDHLPVAVVNNDKATEYDGKVVEVGKELVDKLQDERPLGFEFVSADQAATGLKDGTYYMVITIPENFSENATTVLDEQPKKMELSYDTNPGTNYIASKMSETAVNKIRTSVAEQVTNKYAEVIVEKFGTINDGLIDATDGTKELDEGADKLKDGSTTLATNLATLSESTLTFKDGAETLHVSLGTYTDGVSTLKNGADKLNEGTSAYTDAVGKLSAGSSELASKNQALNNGVGAVAGGLAELKVGSTGALGGVQAMSDQLAAGLTEEKLTLLNETLYPSLQLLDAKLKVADEKLSSLNETKLKEDFTSIKNGAINTGKYLGGIKTDVDDAVSKIEKSDAFKTLSEEQKQEILDAVNGITTGDNYTEAVSSNNSALKGLGGIAGQLENAEATDLAKVTELKGQIHAMVEGDLVANAKATIANQLESLQLIQTKVDQVGKTPNTMGLLQVMKAVNNGVLKLDAGVNGEDGLQASVGRYTGAVDTVNQGLGTLDGKSPALMSGLTQLTAGATKLTDNNGKLMQGASKLSDGADKINDASGKLADGANTLEEGMGTLTDGTSELHEKIADSSKELEDTLKPTGKHTSDMISEPVITQNTEVSSVDNNGNAMAAYMMGVGLWVGCLAFSIMFSLDQPAGKITTGFRWWLSKASIGYLIAVVQPIVMVFSLKGILGLNPVYLGKTILIAELASIAFMSIFYLFNVLMGKVGSFMLLVFMVLQLGGSAGTYPIELSSDFYKAIHPFMPFTYSVDAFRATIASGQSITTSVQVFIGIFVAATALAIAVFEFKARRAHAKEAVMNLEAVTE